MKNILYTLALLVSFNSFGQGSKKIPNAKTYEFGQGYSDMVAEICK